MEQSIHDMELHDKKFDPSLCLIDPGLIWIHAGPTIIQCFIL